jgi:hypothetical protein
MERQYLNGILPNTARCPEDQNPFLPHLLSSRFKFNVSTTDQS